MLNRRIGRSDLAMGALRTPDERFANLPGYPFAPNYVKVETGGIPALRMPIWMRARRMRPLLYSSTGNPRGHFGNAT